MVQYRLCRIVIVVSWLTSAGNKNAALILAGFAIFIAPVDCGPKSTWLLPSELFPKRLRVSAN